MRIKIKLTSPAAKLPEFHSGNAAGADLYACENVIITPGCRALVSCGFSMEIPQSFEAQIRPRSGLAVKYGVTVLNAPGTIDSDYRGPVGVVLANFGMDSFAVHVGDRIAQMVIAPLPAIKYVSVSELSDTLRGGAGFGSTGDH